MHDLLEVRDLAVRFPVRGAVRDAGQPAMVTAVRDLNLSIGEGEAVGLVGESGSGKSVTSLSILRLLPPEARVSGAIRFGGEDLLQVPDKTMRAVRGSRIAMIFQEPMTALNPVMRVGDQIAEAVLAHGPGRSAKAKAWRLALDAMRDVGIPDHEVRARDYPHQLSGGMRQRIMIAMAIVNHPQLLIADEPTTALDVTIQAQILELLAELRHKFGLAMLFISHDLAVVSNVCDRIAVMYAGGLVEVGRSADVFARPAHPYTRGLLECSPTLRTDRSRPLRTIEGAVPAAANLPAGCPFEPRCGFRISQCAQAIPPLVEVGAAHWARCPVVAEHPAAGATL